MFILRTKWHTKRKINPTSNGSTGFPWFMNRLFFFKKKYVLGIEIRLVAYILFVTKICLGIVSMRYSLQISEVAFCQIVFKMKVKIANVNLAWLTVVDAYIISECINRPTYTSTRVGGLRRCCLTDFTIMPNCNHTKMRLIDFYKKTDLR